MSTEKYAITSVGNILPLNTKDEVKLALDKFNNLKEEFKQESASIIFNECNAHNIPIPDNSELYRFINLSEEIIDKVKVFDCEYFYVSSNDLDDGHSSINSLEPMSTSINKAIKRSDIFKSNISVNPNSSMGKTFLANLFTIKKENNDFEFIKIALIEVTYYNKFTYSYEIKKIYTFDNNEVYKDSKKNDNDGILDEDINDVLNNDSDAVDFFYLGEASDFKRGDLKDDDFGIPELRKFPMHDKKHVLLAIKFFNTYVGTKYEKELADNINRKIKEFKIDDSEIHMTNANQFKKYYKPYSKDGKILREEFHISGDIYGWYASEKKLPEPLCKGSVDEDLTYPDFNDAVRACNTTKQALKMYDDGELVGKKFKCHMYAFDRDMNPEYKGEYEYSISNKEFKGRCPWIDGNYIKNESLSIIYGKAYTYKLLKTIHDLDEFKENMITIFKDHNTMSDDMILKTMRKIVLPNTEVIGYVGLSEYNIDDKKYLGIGNFMIFKNYQRQGHGTRVIKDIISIYSNEYDEIYCYVDKNNKTAITFYKKIANVNINNLTKYGYYVTLYKKDTLTESFNDKWHNIKNIIFDLGNVLVSCDLVSELMNKLNFTEEQAHKIENIIYPKEGIYEHLSLDEFKDALIERFRNFNVSISEEELDTLMNCVKSSIKVKPYTISMIRNMIDIGDRVYYLSNWAKWLRELADDNLDFIYSMNGGVFSYEIGSVKPEKSIYTTLLDKYNLNPTECIFFDDKINNVNSAENNGICGVLVTSDFDEDRFYSSIREAEARINNSIIKEEYSNINANILTDLVVAYYFSEEKLEDDKLSTKYIDENHLYKDFNTALLNSDYVKSIIKNLTIDEIRRTEFEAFVYSIDSANNLYYTGSIKFRLSNDGDDYYLDYWQWYEKNENNVLIESIFFSRKDSYINFEKFESGESNILLITGLSGSGKSTLAKEMADKYDAINLELDLFEQCYIFNSIEDIKKYEPPMYEYFSRNNNLYEKLKNKELHNQALWKEIKNYCKWLVSYCSKDTKNRYVIEGVQIYGHLSSTDVNGLPLIFKNTSMSKSMYRRIKRSKNNNEDMSFKNQEYFKMLSWYFGEENAFKEFKKIINKSSKNEDMDVLNEDIESIYSSIYARVSIDKEKNAFILKGFNFKKFLTRLRSYYDYRGITNLFDKNYSWWSEMMWKKEKIKKADMKIINLEVPLFFALEMYKIFEELGDFYGLSYYKKISRLIYKKTWISNADKITTSNLTPLTNASRLRYNLLDHQKRFIEHYGYLKYKFDLDGYVLAFKPGYGKTLTAVALAECLDKDQIIIVCENTLKENWSYEIKDYFEKYDDEKKFKDEVFVTNHPKYTYTNKTKYIIVNMDNVKSCYKYIKKNSNTMIIVDECHNFKNYFNKRCQELFALKEMTKCKDNLMMSGTPLKVSAIESVPSLKMIDSHMTDDIAKRYIKSFNSKNTQLSKVVYERYNRVMYRDKNVDLGLPDKNIHTVSLKIRNSEDYLIRVINAQVGELFIKYYNEQIQKLSQYQSEFESLVYRYSDMSRNETKKYLKFIYTYTYNRMDVANKYHEYRIEIYTKFLNDHVYNNSNMSKVDRDRLEFLVKNYVHVYNVAMGKANGEILPKARANCYSDIFNQNVKYFTDLIDKCPKKTIIFTPYKSIVSNVVDTLKKNDIGVVYITGDVKGKDRMSELERFKNDDSIDVLVATTKTLSTGVTLIEATQMFFLGTPYRQTDFNQACDRIYRIGQTMNVDIYKVLLDTNNEPNLTTRIEQILNWSDEMANSLLNEDYSILDESVNNRAKIIEIAKKKFEENGFKANFGKNQDRFINGSGKNGLCDENSFCVSGLGNQYSKITKCCSQINKEIKPLGGKISPDNYGTAFIKCKPLTEDIDIIDEVAGVAVAPSVEGKSPYVVDTYDYIEQKKLSNINPVEKLNDVLDKFDRDKNGVAKLDESIITYKDLASNNIILDESVVMSQNTLWGLKRVRINAQNMERYSEELKRIGYYKIRKVYNPKVDAGEFLLDNNDNIKACILIDCSYEIKNVPINCLYFIYVDKEVCNEHSRVEWLNKLINIAQNKYSVEVIEADSNDKELIQLLIEDKFGYSVLDNNGKILTLTCYDGLLEDFNLVFNESEIPDNCEVTNYDTHVYIPLINKANQPTVLEQLGTTNGVRSDYGLWNPIIYADGKKFRERAECIIFNDNNEIYMSVNLNRCRIPGGGSMPNKLIEDQLIDECREEARINIKDLEYVGVYRNMYTEAHQEIYDKRDDIENVHYDGALTYLFIAKYDSKYTGDISAYDKDDIIMTGRFIPMTDVIAKYNIKDEWKVAIIKYMAKFNNSYAELYKKFNMDTRFLYINDNDNSNIRLVSEDWTILNEASNKGKRTKIKRQEMEKTIYTFFSLIDKTGKNAEKYKNKFSKMTDKQFFDYMDDFLNDDKKNFYLEILPNLNEPSLKQIKEVADYLGINLDEYIFYRSYGDDKQPVRSPYKVPVGYISIRRLRVKRKLINLNKRLLPILSNDLLLIISHMRSWKQLGVKLSEVA